MRALMKGLTLALIVLVTAPSEASAWNRGRVRVFATLPAGASGPEGLEVAARGHVYVATFGFTATGPASGEGQLYVFDDDGRLLRQVSIAGSSSHLLGLLLVNDFGNAQVLAVDPVTGSSSVYTRPRCSSRTPATTP